MKWFLGLWPLLLLASVAAAQQPQTQTNPLVSVNARWANGVGVGYAPTAGAGLTLNLGNGRVRCGNTMTNYTASTLTMANNTTNYVFLDTGSSCAPSSNTSGYTPSLIEIATVVTSGGAITSITDDRVMGISSRTGGAPGTVTTFSSGNLSPLFTASVSNPTTTPALSFTQSNFAAHTFYGNNTGSTAAPGAQSIGESDLPAATVFTDQNATFGAHTYDFSGSTLVKARFSAGLTTSTNGDFGYDTTNKNWHLWTNGADKTAGVWSATPTNGNCVQASVSSSVILLLDSGNPCSTAAGTVTHTGSLTSGQLIKGNGSADVTVGDLTGDVTTSGSTATTLGSNFKKRGIPFAIGAPDNSSALTVAATTTDYITVPFACTISAYNLLIDAGTITVKFWKVATGTAIPTSSNSISTSGVGISTGTAIHSTTTSDFTTTTVTANDIMAMNVTAVATAKYVSGVLECDQ